MVLGNTGSGKTTTVLKLLGNDFEAAEERGDTIYVPKVLNPEHASFCTSSEAKSCTRHINAALIPKAMMEKVLKREEVLICDTPGFGDTNGIEVDIANQVGMVQALHECSSVRLLVILPATSLLISNSRARRAQ